VQKQRASALTRCRVLLFTQRSALALTRNTQVLMRLDELPWEEQQGFAPLRCAHLRRAGMSLFIYENYSVFIYETTIPGSVVHDGRYTIMLNEKPFFSLDAVELQCLLFELFPAPTPEVTP
jgi:hypothetical protein